MIQAEGQRPRLSSSANNDKGIPVMMKTFLRFMGACAVGVSLQAFGLDVKSDHPDSYVVKRGDTLWDISGKFLEKPWHWPELWQANPQIENPHLIYPGDVLTLVYIDGKPALRVTRGPNSGTYKLSPQAKITPLASPIPAIPLDAISPFLVGNRVLTQEEVKAAPYVLAGDEKHIAMGAGDYMYARGDWSQAATTYGVYREGVNYIDPDTKEFLGFGAIDLGTARYEHNEADIARFKILTSSADVRVDDRLIETEERKVDSIFYPKPPAVEVHGHIIHVFSGVRNVSQYDVVVLNRGEREGLAVGDVLTIKGQGETVKDRRTDELVKLPNERRGVLIVFRTFEKVSYGLILRAQSVIKVGDIIENPT